MQGEPPLLEVQDLYIRFGGVIAAAGIHLRVHRGEVLAIIGPNGAGKTTFLNICTGYLRPEKGKVFLEGREITGLPPRTIAHMGVARAFQIPQLFSEHTIEQNLLLALSAREGFWNLTPLDNPARRSKARELLALMGLSEFAQMLVAEAPEGVRKLADVAMALALAPKLLLLDEPTSGVAAQEKHRIMEVLIGALRSHNVTTVFVEHDMEVVQRYADRVAVWADGRLLVEGPPHSVLADPRVLTTVVGVEVGE